MNNLGLLNSKPFKVTMRMVKLIIILVSLYFFICSLSFLSDSFRLIGGKNLGGK